MRLLIDTQILAWAANGDKRLPSRIVDAMSQPGNDLCVSAATAWEFEDLAARGRLPNVTTFAQVIDLFDLNVLPLPSDLWKRIAQLPLLHRDPVDRMVVAHAIHEKFVLVTADKIMRRYPVETLW